MVYPKSVDIKIVIVVNNYAFLWITAQSGLESGVYELHKRTRKPCMGKELFWDKKITPEIKSATKDANQTIADRNASLEATRARLPVEKPERKTLIVLIPNRARAAVKRSVVLTAVIPKNTDPSTSATNSAWRAFIGSCVTENVIRLTKPNAKKASEKKEAKRSTLYV